jgi:hypothetical protein
MLYVPCALTPAATEIFLYCLEIAADLACADTPDDMWTTAYPRVAQCFSRQQARQVWLDLRDTLQQPQTYVPTTYHWLLMYECLSCHIEYLNDDPEPQIIAALKASRVARDTAYLAFPRGRYGRERLSIDFEAFIGMYFWDTDFLLHASTYAQLGSSAKRQLGFRADLFGVVSGLLPHPAELVLQPLEEAEAPGPEGEAGHGELS